MEKRIEIRANFSDEGFGFYDENGDSVPWQEAAVRLNALEAENKELKRELREESAARELAENAHAQLKARCERLHDGLRDLLIVCSRAKGFHVEDIDRARAALKDGE